VQGDARAGGSDLEADGRTWTCLEGLREGLRSLLVRHCRDESEVEDVIQETFLRAYRYRHGLAREVRLRSWTMRIALNVLSDARRRASRVRCAAPGESLWEELEAPQEDAAADEGDGTYRLGEWELGKEAALEHVSRALSALRLEDRRVLDSFYRGSQSCRTTGQECGIPRHLVKIRLFRARRRLLKGLRRNLALWAQAGGRPRGSQA
jgi:RNA polymerase sigma-70 factor (ECF subfamily)